MLRISRFIGKCLLFLFFLSRTAISADISVDNMPRKFSGEFLWRKHNAVPYAVTLKIAVIEEANDGNLIFKGLHVYQPGNYLMKVKGTIDPKTAHISIFEMDPSREDSVTDGSFEGRIAEDMSSITAVWTTRTTGEKGDIFLKAVRGEFTKTEEIKETDSVALLNQGISYCKEGQYDRSIAYFNKAIEINPRYVEAYINRGIAYAEGKGQYDRAIGDYNKAIEINPRDAKAYLNRGGSYYLKGQDNKAVSDYTTAIEINPKYAMAYYSRGLTHFRIGQYDKAKADYTKAIEINPKYAEAYLNRGIAYAEGKGQYDRAINDYNKAIEINPRVAMVYYNRGLTHFRIDQYDKAIADYTKAIEINPRDAYAYNNRGYTYYNKGQYDKAIADYTKAIEINPRLAEAYYGRGGTYFYKREYDKAWDDVHQTQNLGLQVHPTFLKELRHASGRQK